MAVATAFLAPPASSAGKPVEGAHLTVAASGDLLIHAPVWKRALVYGRGRRYDFRPMFRAVRPLIAGADLALCHLETPLTYGPPRGYPSFRAPVALAPAIRATGWDACSTASNHTLDGGQRGVNATLRILDRFRIRHTGSSRTRAGARRLTVLKARGVKVALLAYTALSNGQRVPHPWTVNMARASRIVRAARRARRAGADAVIVNLHWGAEYRHAPTRAQRSLAAALTRSSAVTAVVGQHAHVVQPIRWIHGKPVVFGEGNLLSNQTAACCPASSQDGLIALLDLRVVRGGVRAVRVRYRPTSVRHPDFTVVRARGASRSRTIRVAGRSRRVVPIR
ncbi:MAG TPA: CapA family protein [Thermoleophilaceae bacterium]|nr:CapA family protein [Thermoleophilaceae bacterium]